MYCQADTVDLTPWMLQTESISQLKEDLIKTQSQLRAASDTVQDERSSKHKAEEEVIKFKLLLETKDVALAETKGQLNREQVYSFGLPFIFQSAA